VFVGGMIVGLGDEAAGVVGRSTEGTLVVGTEVVAPRPQEASDKVAVQTSNCLIFRVRTLNGIR